MNILLFSKKSILLFIILFLLSCALKPKLISYSTKEKNYSMKIGFGSCLDQAKPMPIFDAIKGENLDLFLMIGDNVYGDSEDKDLDELRSAYESQRQNFEIMNLNFPFEAIWDDHDYGMNDAGVEYPHKKKSKELFLNFWDVQEDDIRRFREGLYFDIIKNINDKKLQIIFLDTRTFRDSLRASDQIGKPGKERYLPNPDKSLTILGTDQWRWVKEKIGQKVDFRIIISSIQFLAIGHGWESWNNFPLERAKLIDIIDKANLNNTLILSGDRHRAGIYEIKTESGKIISEVTSSSLNASFPNDEENGPLRIGNTYVEENYGVISIDSKNRRLMASIRDIDGETIGKLTINNKN